MAELKKRFTPVGLMTQLFHDCRQGPQETVDDFAQDLRRLYSQAYAGLLASKFVAGLRLNLQAKIAGDMDQLMPKACFEEAKSKKLISLKASQATSSVSGGNPWP